MNISFTSRGVFVEPTVDCRYMTGPSMSREEQLNRLSALRKVKGMREKKQKEIGESIFK